MNIGEAIKHCIEEAEKQEITAKSNIIEIEKTEAEVILRLYDADEYESCMKCAFEHRQLAEWLKELKAYRKAEKKILENMRAWEKIYAEPLEWNVDDINSIKLAFYQEGKADAYTDCIGICEIAFGEVNADELDGNSN